MWMSLEDFESLKKLYVKDGEIGGIWWLWWPKEHIRNSLSEEIWFGSDRSLDEEKFKTWMQTERVWKNMERL